MKRNEDIIRENLAKNLSFIDSDLTLAEEEYYLKNKYGSNGFIDILATDSENNYVIIEIKRSNHSSRETLNEILKYAGLLRQNLKIKQSELRIIVVSTEWAELLVPFSEYVRESIYNIEGYKLEVDSNYFPTKIESIEIIPEEWIREFSRNHTCFYYQNGYLVSPTIKKIKSLLPSYGISDFAILVLNPKNDIDPFELHLIIQKYSTDYFTNCLKRICTEKKNNCVNHDEINEILNQSVEFDDEESYLYELESLVLGEFIYGKDAIEYDSLDNSYPEKLMYKLNQNYEVLGIIRNGFFENDQRLNDSTLLYEILGFNGSNQLCYYNYANSKNKAKILEIKKDSLNCLCFNEVWKKHISTIFSRLTKINKFTVSINVFNPDSILESIFACSQNKDSIPAYEIIVENLDVNSIQVYNGFISWTKNNVQLKQIVDIFFEGDAFNIFMQKQFGTIGLLDSKIMKILGLSYETSLTEIKPDTIDIHRLEYNDGDFRIEEMKSSEMFLDFLTYRSDLVRDVIDIYAEYMFIPNYNIQ
ncbi:Protein of unknown function DUF91 [Methanolobus vulcani]|uniref:DUF91 domain-containing protein n=1 Tax=Methanolobus vulcani TaxID=38026 RepID=A0A7Z7AZT4_9EURY|nr:endonuclease NucS domain-containing protein [Methanolobus vulcani]SDF93446.1 Protein of unknown function DUF91 [Methanolobus vulcani]